MIKFRKINIIHFQELLDIGELEKGIINLVNNIDQKRFNISIFYLNKLGKLKNKVVVTDVGSNKELIKDKVTGLLVSSVNVDELSDRIFELLCNKNLVISMGKKSQQKVELNFSQDKMVKSYESFYHDLTKKEGIV